MQNIVHCFLLNSRNQFPSLSIRAEPPSIPAWQLQSSRSADESPRQSDNEKDCKDAEDDIIRLRGERSESGGSNSSEGEVATKNSDSSLEIMWEFFLNFCFYNFFAIVLNAINVFFIFL